MKEFYIVGQYQYGIQGEQELEVYSYGGSVVRNRESAAVVIDLCNKHWPSNSRQSEWKLFKIVEVTE